MKINLNKIAVVVIPRLQQIVSVLGNLRIWLIMKFVMKMVRLVIVEIMFMTIKGEW